MTFRVGQKVVCVDDGPNANGLIPSVRTGETFTVATIDPTIRFGAYGVQLVERAARAPTYVFRADRFRAVHETNISIFTAMLDKTPERVG